MVQHFNPLPLQKTTYFTPLFQIEMLTYKIGNLSMRNAYGLTKGFILCGLVRGGGVLCGDNISPSIKSNGHTNSFEKRLV